jgi:hypothetical protein
MNEATQTALQALDVPDEAFYAASDTPFDQVVQAIAPDLDAPASGSGSRVPPVFALGLPRVVDVARNPVVPGVLALRSPVVRQWEVHWQQNLCFVVVDLLTGAVRTTSQMLPDKRMATPQPSRSGPEPSALDRVSTTHGIERFNLAPVFGSAWPSAAYAVTALYYDWVTNTAVIERRPHPESGFRPARAPSAFLRLEAPTVEAAQGLAISVPASARGGGPIRIACRVGAPRASVALVESTDEPDAQLMVADLLLVQLDSASPRQVTLVVPVAIDGDTVSAAFSFDLAAQPEGAALAGEYQVYLVSGRSVAGPVVLTVAPP